MLAGDAVDSKLIELGKGRGEWRAEVVKSIVNRRIAGAETQ